MTKDRSYSTAIHILVALAYNTPKLMSSDDLAVGLQSNPAFVRRMLLQLSEARLINTTKGKGGGSQLALPASKISLFEVYRAVRPGPLFGSFDKEPFKGCPVSCNIGNVLTEVYETLESEVEQKMKRIKLSKIIEQI